MIFPYISPLLDAGRNWESTHGSLLPCSLLLNHPLKAASLTLLWRKEGYTLGDQSGARPSCYIISFSFFSFIQALLSLSFPSFPFLPPPHCSSATGSTRMKKKKFQCTIPQPFHLRPFPEPLSVLAQHDEAECIRKCWVRGNRALGGLKAPRGLRAQGAL